MKKKIALVGAAALLTIGTVGAQQKREVVKDIKQYKSEKMRKDSVNQKYAKDLEKTWKKFQLEQNTTKTK